MADCVPISEPILADWEVGNSKHWDRVPNEAGLRRSDGSQVMGTVLMQLLDHRRLQVEVFMAKRASQVTGLTNAALVYER